MPEDRHGLETRVRVSERSEAQHATCVTACAKDCSSRGGREPVLQRVLVATKQRANLVAFIKDHQGCVGYVYIISLSSNSVKTGLLN